MLTQDMTLIADLWQLQEIDSALDSRRASLDDARERLGESEEIVAVRARVDELVDVLHRAEATQKDLELQADDVKAKIAPLETKLYGGSVRNPKELSDLQKDVEQLKRHLSAIEDRDLEALSAVEAAEADVRAARAELAALEGAWAQEQAELVERLERLTGEVAAYQARRREQAGRIPREALARYDHLRGAHQGRGAAKLDRNICTGCRISLPTTVVNKARAGSALVQCPNCERILCA